MLGGGGGGGGGGSWLKITFLNLFIFVLYLALQQHSDGIILFVVFMRVQFVQR